MVDAGITVLGAVLGAHQTAQQETRHRFTDQLTEGKVNLTMMTAMGGGMIAMMIAAWVFYLALLILVVLCIAWLVRDLRRSAAGSQNGELK